MSMEVSGNYEDYRFGNKASDHDYLNRLQDGGDRTKEAGKESGAGDKRAAIPVPRDEYISSEQSGSRPSGLYYMGKDENGKPKVVYDDPKKTGGPGRNGASGVRDDGPEKEKETERAKARPGSREDAAEEVTVNTDAVDREIEKLKKEKQQLEQQVRKASGDEEKTRELEKKIAQIERELSQKDNDAYRRKHAVITSSSGAH